MASEACAAAHEDAKQHSIRRTGRAGHLNKSREISAGMSEEPAVQTLLALAAQIRILRILDWKTK